MTERDYSEALARNRRAIASDLFWHGGPHDRIGCRDGIDPNPHTLRTTEQNLGEVACFLSVDPESGVIEILPSDNYQEVLPEKSS